MMSIERASSTDVTGRWHTRDGSEHMTTLRPLSQIIVAMDFSPNAERAFGWALALAKPHGATVLVIHAIEPDLEFASDEGRAKYEKTLETRAVHLMKQAEAEGVETQFGLGDGQPWEVLTQIADEREVDLIITGSRGLNPFDRILLGSVADRVLRHAAMPVLTIHPDDAPPAEVRTVLAATDFTAEADHAVAESARLIAGVEGATLYLLHVNMPPIVFAEVDIPTTLVYQDDAADELAQKRLAEAKARYEKSLGVKVETRLATGYAAEAILREASLIKPDLIALGTHRRDWLDRLLLGSIAERVVHHADRAVLTVRVSED